jgi:hypothetical protein
MVAVPLNHDKYQSNHAPQMMIRSIQLMTDQKQLQRICYALDSQKYGAPDQDARHIVALCTLNGEIRQSLCRYTQVPWPNARRQ